MSDDPATFIFAPACKAVVRGRAYAFNGNFCPAIDPNLGGGPRPHTAIEPRRRPRAPTDLLGE